MQRGEVRHVTVSLPITLGQFLKVADVTATGGAAKALIASGRVAVNGGVETKRGRKLKHGDRVEVGGTAAVVRVDDSPKQNAQPQIKGHPHDAVSGR